MACRQAPGQLRDPRVGAHLVGRFACGRRPHAPDGRTAIPVAFRLGSGCFAPNSAMQQAVSIRERLRQLTSGNIPPQGFRQQCKKWLSSQSVAQVELKFRECLPVRAGKHLLSAFEVAGPARCKVGRTRKSEWLPPSRLQNVGGRQIRINAIDVRCSGIGIVAVTGRHLARGIEIRECLPS
jgi:hypothetical protein